MSKSPVAVVDSSDGYDRSVWSTMDKPHPTRSDAIAFEEEWRSRTATPAV